MDQLPLFFTLTTILVTIGLSFLAIYFATQPGACLLYTSRCV